MGKASVVSYLFTIKNYLKIHLLQEKMIKILEKTLNVAAELEYPSKINKKFPHKNLISWVTSPCAKFQTNISDI